MDLKEMYPAAITIVIFGIVLGIGLYVMSEVRENIATTQTGIQSNINLTQTSPTNVTTLANASLDDYKLLTISIINITGTTLTNNVDYNYTTGGVITWNAAQTASGTNLANVTTTFIYDVTDSPEEGLNNSLEGLADFADWIAIIVVVIAAAIVLGIVLKSFGQGREA